MKSPLFAIGLLSLLIGGLIAFSGLAACITEHTFPAQPEPNPSESRWRKASRHAADFGGQGCVHFFPPLILVLFAVMIGHILYQASKSWREYKGALAAFTIGTAMASSGAAMIWNAYRSGSH